ncbi:hypothetical protein D3C81_1451300 [compost metagenome]
MHVRRTAQNVFAELGDGVDQVFAVVDDQQHLPVAQTVGKTAQGGVVVQGQFEQRRQMTVDHQRAVDRGQVQQANAVPVATDHLFGDPQGHGGLADAAGTDEGDEALAWQLHHQIVDQGLPADHSRAAHRQVMPARCASHGRWRLLGLLQ